jgi:hypothetical protein
MRMRIVACLVLLMSLGAHAQGVPDALEITQYFADAG